MKKQKSISTKFFFKEGKKKNKLYCRVSYNRVNSSFRIGEEYAPHISIDELDIDYKEKRIEAIIRFLEKKNFDVKMTGFSKLLDACEIPINSLVSGYVVKNIISEIGEFVPYNIVRDAFRKSYISPDDLFEDASFWFVDVFKYLEKNYDKDILKRLSKSSKQEYFLFLFLQEQFFESVFDFVSDEPFRQEFKVSLEKNFTKVLKKTYKIPSTMLDFDIEIIFNRVNDICGDFFYTKTPVAKMRIN